MAYHSLIFLLCATIAQWTPSSICRVCAWVSFEAGFGFLPKNMAMKVLKNAEKLNEFHSFYSYTLMCPCICHFNIFTLTHVYSSTHLPFNPSIHMIVFIHIKVSLRSAGFTWDIKITGSQYLLKILFVWGKKKSHILNPINLRYATWWVLTNAFTCANQSDTEYCHQRNLLPAISHHHQRKVLFCVSIGNKHTHSSQKSYIIKNLFIFAFALNYIFLTYLCCFMSHVPAHSICTRVKAWCCMYMPHGLLVILCDGDLYNFHL